MASSSPLRTAGKLALELAVVFAGVYLAFVLNNYREHQRNVAEQDKVLRAIKRELESFRVLMPGKAQYQASTVAQWWEQFNEDDLPPYYEFRFLEPQYDHMQIEYALNLEGTDIISYELHQKLSALYRHILRLEHAERLMTEFATRYYNLPEDWDRDSEQWYSQFAQNKFHCYRFIQAAEDRTQSLFDLAAYSADVLKLINAHFSPRALREMHRQLILEYITDMNEVDLRQVQGLVKQYFPEFDEAEVESILSEGLAARKAAE